MNPPFADFHTEQALEDFKIQIECLKNLLPNDRRNNLPRLQQFTLWQLQQRQDLIILNTNKNLGIVVMNQQEYITSILLKHFSDTNLYAHITPNKVNEILDNA